MPAKVLVITGTPGTGKSSLAEELRKDGYFTLNLHDFARKYDCIDSFDAERDTEVVDIEKLVVQLEDYLTAGHGVVVVESHYGDVVPDQYVAKCFVLSTDIKDLRSRLTLRGYSKEKVEENVQAEIMQECWVNALDAFGSKKVTKISNMTVAELAALVKTYITILLQNMDRV